jgi:hypothetical protein
MSHDWPEFPMIIQGFRVEPRSGLRSGEERYIKCRCSCKKSNISLAHHRKYREFDIESESRSGRIQMKFSNQRKCSSYSM